MTRSERLLEMAERMYQLAAEVDRKADEIRQSGEDETEIGQIKVERLEERGHHMRLRASDIKVEAVIAEGMTELIGVAKEIRDAMPGKGEGRI